MSTKTNIIFIFADDLGFGDLACYGSPNILTPNLDRLAARGTRFHQFHVASPVCSPSRAAALTGKYPAHTRIHHFLAKCTINEARDMPNWLDPNCITTPKLLKQAGYATAHYGKWHLGGGCGIAGHPDAPVPTAYGFDDARVWNGNGPTWDGTNLWPFAIDNDSDKNFLFNSDRLAVESAMSFIEENQDKPFYLDVWLRAPHAPLVATPEQREPYKDVPEPQQTYYSVVTQADKQIGRLMDKVDELGLTENTLIIFSSDNGPETPNKMNPEVTQYCQGSTGGLRGRKRSLYEGGIRVPFIASLKNKIPEGEANFDTLLSSVDLLPTFCELAGVDIDTADFDGENILPALSGQDYTREKPIMWEFLFNDRSENSTKSPVHAIRQGDYMLLKNPSNNRVELFNIMKDYAQTQNIANKHPELVAELSKQLDAWMTELPAMATRYE